MTRGIFIYSFDKLRMSGEGARNDRKGKALSPDDIRHYCRVITALKKTMEIQHDIDALYPEVEKEVVAVDL